MDNQQHPRKSRKTKIVIIVAVTTIIVAVIVTLGIAVYLDLKKPPVPNAESRPIVVVISIDGFRWDYLHRNTTPNINHVMEMGVSAEWMITQFPTSTFPNHYTLVTGLYPESHGIVANRFYDPILNSSFNLRPDILQQSSWWGGEPVWVTAETQNTRAAVFAWPGGEAAIKGVQATYHTAFHTNTEPAEGFDQIKKWLQLLEEERPALILAYFDLVDRAGHAYGPNSAEVDDAVHKIDSSLGDFLNWKDEQDYLAGRLHVIVVSDHGMAPIKDSETILLDRYLDLSTITVDNWSPFCTIRPKNGNDAAVFAALQSVPNSTVYLKEDFPARLHYGNNLRIAPIILVANLSHTISYSSYWESAPAMFNGGAHGYDNLYPEMKSMFLGMGPSFKSNYRREPIQNLDVYSLICRLLALQPAPNNGTMETVLDFLAR